MISLVLFFRKPGVTPCYTFLAQTGPSDLIRSKTPDLQQIAHRLYSINNSNNIHPEQSSTNKQDNN
jgi:hypothetical protein